jgi:hypothetical protein
MRFARARYGIVRVTGERAAFAVPNCTFWAARMDAR